jgi:hypothetical protein
MVARTLCALVVTPLAVVVAVSLSPSFPLATAFFAIGIALNGFTASWFFAGLGSPRSIILNEGIPRLLGYVAALVGVSSGLGLTWYGFCTILSGATSVGLNWTSIMRSRSKDTHPPQDAAAPGVSIRTAFSGTTARLVQALYYFGSTSIAATLGLHQARTFVAADQLQKASNNALSVIPMALIPWISASSRGRRRRQRQALIFLLASAVVVFAGWIWAAPTIVHFLFSGNLNLSVDQVVLLGGTMVTYYGARYVELLILVPFERTAAIWNTTLACAIAGIVGVSVAALTAGLTQVLLAGALVQAAQLGVYAIVAIRDGARRR